MPLVPASLPCVASTGCSALVLPPSVVPSVSSLTTLVPSARSKLRISSFLEPWKTHPPSVRFQLPLSAPSCSLTLNVSPLTTIARLCLTSVSAAPAFLLGDAADVAPVGATLGEAAFEEGAIDEGAAGDGMPPVPVFPVSSPSSASSPRSASAGFSALVLPALVLPHKLASAACTSARFDSGKIQPVRGLHQVPPPMSLILSLCWYVSPLTSTAEPMLTSGIASATCTSVRCDSGKIQPVRGLHQVPPPMSLILSLCWYVSPLTSTREPRRTDMLFAQSATFGPHSKLRGGQIVSGVAIKCESVF